MLDEKLQDLAIRENAHVSPARIAERAAIPIDPVFPRKTITLIIAAMMGMMVGLGVAFMQEHLDDRLNTPEEVNRALGLPVLGCVPVVSARQSPLMTSLPPRGPVADSYRWLRSSISFASEDQPLRTILITSTAPNEGKSVTAINLAMAMAMEGRSVILVDADLRRPSIHHLLELPSTPGLTDVLHHHLPLEQGLRPTDVSGLLVLPSGSLAPNPAELVHSTAMDALITELVDKADVVIFDSPPSAAVLDAQLLSAKVDGVLLVADIRGARRPGLEYVLGQFDRARARVIGLVFNKVRRNQGRSHGYYCRSYYEEGRDSTGNGYSNGHRSGKRHDEKELALMGRPATPENPDHRP